MNIFRNRNGAINISNIIIIIIIIIIYIETVKRVLQWVNMLCYLICLKNIEAWSYQILQQFEE